jgi:protein-tyrosine-phosphatase
LVAVFPSSVLFCCDHNAVRSPMAEGLMKKYYGQVAYVQSAGVHSDMDVDGFTVAVCAEFGVELSRHKTRSLENMQDWGDDISSYDLIVALSPASQRLALELTRIYHLEVEYWPIMDPTGIGEARESKLAVYRQTRDQIVTRMLARFGPPTTEKSAGAAG